MSEPSIPNVETATPDCSPLLLTIPEACTVLRLSRWSVYQLINQRRLKTVRAGRRHLIARADLVALVDELRAEGADDGA